MFLNHVENAKKEMEAKNLIIGSAEIVEAKRKQAQRATMGADFRNHNGARGQVHKSAKQYKRVKSVDIRRGWDF